MSARITLFTKADDLGNTHAANAAILEAHCTGILRNAGLMVNPACAEEAARMFAGVDTLCLGLHATLTAEWDALRWGPVLGAEKVPSLVDEKGYLFKTTQAVREHAKLDEVMAELEAQLRKALALGVDVKYADLHMGGAWVVDDLAGREGTYRQWVADKGLRVPAAYGKRLSLEELDRSAPVEVWVDALLTALDRAEPGRYLFVAHPGYNNAEMQGLGHSRTSGPEVAHQRDCERQLFCHPRVVRYFQENDVVSLRFDEAEPNA